ncbi:hypothetical protein [Clostridioides difficile]|uniref:hypothetical protein n=1 Tax=Clostridioides difficile TaxID=1496 RepID=UPI000CF2FA1A|nr:hypothetical protein [Clostridioides difficile]MDC0804223.1 hypothetical protein [Clostridium paraputrificum]AWH83445.1 hypothetical protein DDG63_20640 [Clostridioides difficile]EGT5015163.1 hypothetical protein [Clostridioides difficile]EJX3365434.1 hypothetical protein [Clostridioides difficile]EJX3377957.1 hypothetical protein [Clostridioides difficile]
MIYNNNNFYEEIDGKSAQDYIKNLDYSIDNSKDRIKYIEERLGVKHTWFEESNRNYIDTFYNTLTKRNENIITRVKYQEKKQFNDKFWENIFEQTSDSPLDKDGVYYVTIDGEEVVMDYNRFITWCGYNQINPIEYINVKNPFSNSNGTWEYTHHNTSKIKLILNKDDSIYSTSNIAKTLEIMGSYILSVDDKPKETKIRIYNSKELFNRACQEEALLNKIAPANGGNINSNTSNKDGFLEDNSFAFFQLPKNYKKIKDIKVKPKDIKKYPIIKTYSDTYEWYKAKYKELGHKQLSKEELKLKRMVRKNLNALKNDMTDVKNSIERPIIWKAPLADTGSPEWDYLDMFDKSHVKELLKIQKGNDLQDDLTCIVMDLNNIISKIEFTTVQKDILNLYRKDKSLEFISNLMNITPQAINNQINKIVNKIIDAYEKNYEENYYYISVCKGKYKKCSRCGKIKLLSRFDKNGKKGYRSNCKNCN